MHKRNRDNDTMRIFLAKEVAELVITRYPHLSLYDVKGAMMSAEEFILNSFHRHHEEAADGKDDPLSE